MVGERLSEGGLRGERSVCFERVGRVCFRRKVILGLGSGLLVEGLLEDALAVFFEELAVGFGRFGFVWAVGVGGGRWRVFAGDGFVWRIGWGLAGGL